MKITTSKSQLAAATKVVESAIAGGDDSSLAAHFLFRVVDGAVHILASNGKRLLASSVLTGAVVEGDAATFTVSGWRFAQFLNMSPDNACILDFDGASTKVSIDGRNLRFASLDPSAFPFWDDALKSAQETAVIKAGRLFAALAYVKPFVSTLDTRTPALAATECRAGTFFASDSQSLAMASVPGLEKTAIRFHYADIAPVNAFLGLDADLDISIREQATTTFFVRPDGGVFGVSKWIHAFPELKMSRDYLASFTVNVDILRYGLRFLSVASAKTDDRIRFEFRKGKVVLSVDAVAGGREEFEVDTKDLNKLEDLLDTGRTTFDVNGNHLTALLPTVSGDDVTFGVNWTAKNGYLLYKHMNGNDEYDAIVVWRK